MNFKARKTEAPEINLIPFIDVLLVVLIFLMVTTTYSKFTELKVNLPTAQADALQSQPKEVVVVIGADGRYSINHQVLDRGSVDALTVALAAAASGDRERTVVISADAMAAHQSVINVMDAARRAGLSRLNFATQNGKGKKAS